MIQRQVHVDLCEAGDGVGDGTNGSSVRRLDREYEALLRVGPSMADILKQQMSVLEVPKLVELTVSKVAATTEACEDSDAVNPKVNESSQHVSLDVAYLRSLDGEEFINAAYMQILARAPDQTGYSYYSKRLSDGASRFQILGQLAASGETDIAKELYQRIRLPYLFLRSRKAPVLGWFAEIACAFGRWEIDELLSRDGDQFLSQSYMAVFGRSPDVSGYSNYSKQLLAGRSKFDILVELGSSNEGRRSRGRVAGLRAILLLNRIRRLPFVKQIIDVLTLPWVAVDALHRIRGIDAAIQSLQSKHTSDIEIVKASIHSGQVASQELYDQVARNAAAAIELIGRESAIVSQEVNKVGKDLQLVLLQSQALLLERAQEILTLSATLPKTIEAATIEMLAQLKDRNDIQDNRHSQILSAFDKHSAYSQALVNKGTSELSRKVNELAIDIRLAHDEARLDLAERIREVALMNGSLADSVESAKLEIIGRLAIGQQAQVQLRQQLGRHVVSTAALISGESVALAREVNSVKSALQLALDQLQADFLQLLEQGVTKLSVSTPQIIEAVKKEIAVMLVSGDRLPEQIQIQLSQFRPLLDRIELYSMSTARRVAVPCESGVTMVRTAVGFVLCSSDDHALIAGLLEAGELESGTRILIQRLLGPACTFIDVGANIGMHTLAAARAMQGEGKVIAIEPYAPTARLLERTVWMNGFVSVVDVHQLAASNQCESRSLYLGSTSGHHSLFPLEKSTATDCVPVKVQSVTVDQIAVDLPSVTLIKIDAEGAELEVLAGSLDLLKRSPEVGVIVEFGGSHIRRAGFTIEQWLRRFSELGFVYKAIHADTGALNGVSVEELEKIDSINLIFARPKSSVWEKARGSS